MRDAFATATLTSGRKIFYIAKISAFLSFLKLTAQENCCIFIFGGYHTVYGVWTKLTVDRVNFTENQRLFWGQNLQAILYHHFPVLCVCVCVCVCVVGLLGREGKPLSAGPINGGTMTKIVVGVCECLTFVHS